MCLVLLALNAHPDVALLLGANRDEFHSRPAAPPAVVHEHPVIHAGRDLEAGGTWMGRNEAGLMAALTNRHGSRDETPPDVRSRGEIVMGLLRHRDPDEAREWLQALPLERFRAFNVLFGNPERFYFHGSREPGPPRLLKSGLHALSNSTLDDTSWPKVRRSLEFLRHGQSLRGEALIEGLQDFLGDATPPDQLTSPHRDEEVHGALGAVFIRSEGYGTVSSTILTAGGTLGDRYYFAEGKALARSPREAFKRLDFDL